MEKIIDYKNTLNLPQTKFPMKGNLSQTEPRIQKFWEEKNIYRKILTGREGKPLFILHDGPPYANGDIHLGQAFNKVLKDFILKYKTLRGYLCPFVPGWDCHGLPIEYQLLKELGITKQEVDILKFRKKARNYARRFINRQREQFQRLGIFGEWDNPYLTMDYSYEAAIIKAFGELAQKGYIYRSKKPIYWCMKCETALAEAEVEYRECTSPSIWVKFPLSPKKEGKFILIWTTTPWTLPGNVAVAVHPDYEYAWVKLQYPQFPLSKGKDEGKEEKWLIARDLVQSIMKKFGIKEYKIEEVRKGKELEKIHYCHPFMDRKGVVVLAEYVTLKEGSGCVHTAPGHGEEDYQTSLKYDLPVLSPVNSRGEFTEEAGFFAGRRVNEANGDITETLKGKGYLVEEEKIQHSYPHCWRCKNPIIFRATSQWFMNVDQHELRKKALEKIREVKWIPRQGEKRIEGMLLARPDWCLSRQRYWGVAIPAIYCSLCQKEVLDTQVIAKSIEIVSREGSDAWFQKDLKEILPSGMKCPHCGGGNFQKEKDILDVWFDSGISHLAVLAKRKELHWPADLYVEGSDQHRGWFQTSLLTSMGLKETSPYRAVLTHGFVVDAEGKKMSKSMGNVTDPQEVVKRLGADILRLWVASSDYRNDIRISDEILDMVVNVYRRIRNTARFILGNISDFNPEEDSVPEDQLWEIDRWALMQLSRLVEKARRAYDNFQFHQVYHLLHIFTAQDMSSFYLDVLKDRLYTFGKKSSPRRAAQTVLYKIIMDMVRIMAPLLPFTSEEIWQELKREEESVFLTTFPKVKKWADGEMEERWENFSLLREEVLRAMEIARREGIIRSSLEAEITLGAKGKWNSLLHYFKKDLAMLFIVSKVTVGEGSNSPPSAWKSPDIPGLWVLVKRAPGKKCLRCWNWSQSVGENANFPQLCQKCVKIMEENPEGEEQA